MTKKPAKKKTTAAKPRQTPERYVLVTTVHRGVFAGFARETGGTTVIHALRRPAS